MSGGTRLENANPIIFQRSGERLLTATDEDENVHDPIDDREIFDILCLFWVNAGWFYLILSEKKIALNMCLTTNKNCRLCIDLIVFKNDSLR